MPRAQSLTPRIKDAQKPFVLLRDYELGQDATVDELWCMECGDRFVEYDPDYCLEWDHLIPDRRVNELWNLQFCHAVCNRRRAEWMRGNGAPAGYMARLRARVEKNKQWQERFPFEKWYKARRLERFSTNEESIYIDVSTIISQTTRDVLAEYLGTPGQEYPLIELAAIIADRCQGACGHGSIQAARNHLLVKATPEGKFLKFKRGSTWFLAARPAEVGK